MIQQSLYQLTHFYCWIVYTSYLQHQWVYVCVLCAPEAKVFAHRVETFSARQSYWDEQTGDFRSTVNHHHWDPADGGVHHPLCLPLQLIFMNGEHWLISPLCLELSGQLTLMICQRSVLHSKPDMGYFYLISIQIFPFTNLISFKRSFSLHIMLIDRRKLCGLLVNYYYVFISCLDSHSDGTHSLQWILWWANDVMLHFFCRFDLELIYTLDSLRVSEFSKCQVLYDSAVKPWEPEIWYNYHQTCQQINYSRPQITVFPSILMRSSIFC